MFPEWDREDREQLQEYFYYFQHAGTLPSSLSGHAPKDRTS